MANRFHKGIDGVVEMIIVVFRRIKLDRIWVLVNGIEVVFLMIVSIVELTKFAVRSADNARFKVSQ